MKKSLSFEELDILYHKYIEYSIKKSLLEETNLVKIFTTYTIWEGPVIVSFLG